MFLVLTTGHQPDYHWCVKHDLTNTYKLTKYIRFKHNPTMSGNLYLHKPGFDVILIHACIPNLYIYSICYFIIQAWILYDVISYRKEKYSEFFSMRTNDMTCTINMLLDNIYSHFRYSDYRLKI